MVESGIGVRLRRLNTALLCDVLDTMVFRFSSVGVGIGPLQADMKVVGHAFTMKCVLVNRVSDEPYVELLAGYASMQAGDVVVLETGDRVSAMWGELLSTAAMAKRAVGAVSMEWCEMSIRSSRLDFLCSQPATHLWILRDVRRWLPTAPPFGVETQKSDPGIGYSVM